jgi:hypothetical protein
VELRRRQDILQPQPATPSSFSPGPVPPFFYAFSFKPLFCYDQTFRLNTPHASMFLSKLATLAALATTLAVHTFAAPMPSRSALMARDAARARFVVYQDLFVNGQVGPPALDQITGFNTL